MSPDKAVFPDSHDYIGIAKNVVEGDGIILDEHHRATRPPLYPIFFAGHRILFGDALLPIQITQALLGAVSILLIFALTMMIFDDVTIAKISAVITAIYPYFIYFTGLILYETLFISLLLGMMLLLVYGIRRNKLWTVSLSGFICGLIALLHAGHLLFGLFIIPAIILYARHYCNNFSIGKVIILFLLFTSIPLIPWTVRNYFIFGRFIPVSTQGGYALADSFAPDATGGTDISKVTKWLDEVKNLPEAEQDVALRKRAIDAIMADPLRAFLLSFNKLVYFYSPIPKAEGFNNVFYKLIGLISTLPIFVFAVIGIWCMRRNLTAIILILTPIIYYTILHMVFIGSIVYRLPIEPYIIILASYGGYYLFNKIMARDMLQVS
ncbi:MAG: hypothetical protein A2W23_00975 [Planctomycetes bacterium RBG_16_43_13]|nr:MAG: hypothetical protein A2W23_00975 [Planctomycetes bacterium RBG_16_43_13]